MLPLEVRQAVLGDAAAACAALTDAFGTDPVWEWLVPDAARRRRALGAHFAVECGPIALPYGESRVAVADGAVVGATLVLPPGRWRAPLTTQAAHGWSYTRAFGVRLPVAAALQLAVARHHLRGPHLYIAYVGVVQRLQGGGVGGRLLAPVLARADELRVPTYLEASSPGSRRLYERHGFVARDEIRPLGSPPLWPMVRTAT